MFDISKCPRDKDGNYLSQTVDGTHVVLITTQGREPWPLVGYVADSSHPSSWGSDGRFDDNNVPSRDLINTPESKRSGEVELMVYEELHPPHKGAITTYAVPVGKDPNDDKSMRLIHKSGPYKWTEGDGLGGK